ncbi:uncharacterized protein A4U43_C08F5290 [Asparagus officinalis]|uniref:histone-lysine N-methyltransferase, H3 lysine-9 specific SUVH6-like n=1 Tax=Asparagus officinalis TaxID=4686 RepID=UPI00098E3D87|nr:histone-lysine N-methyltransferase, H3 lysine-9 specific SUVH6-like [Asparagus officinalis]ONK59326.1 uncharacterized protein A4U43_C08F5290 [Asparagus officinalis]
MLELPPRVPINIERRAFSAVRDFPNGCGPKVIPTPNFPPDFKLEFKPKDEEAGGNAASKSSSSFEVPKGSSRIPMDSENFSAESVKKLEPLELSKEEEVLPVSEVVDTIGEGSKVEEEQCRSRKRVNGGVTKQDLGVAKRFSALKRRSASVVRDFPVGCGGNASKICKNASSRAVPVASFGGEVRVNGENAKDERSLENVEDGEGKKDEKQVGERKSDTVLKSLRNEEKNKIAEFGVSPSKRLEDVVQKDDSKEIDLKVEKETPTKSLKVKVKLKGFGVKQLGEDLRGKELRETKVACGTKIDDNVRRSFVEKPVDKRPIDALKNESKKINLKVEEETTIKSLKVKLKGFDAKQLGENLQVKELQETKVPPGTKVEDKEDRSLLNKPVDKRTINILKDGKNLKRKSPKEQGDEFLEVHGNREIVRGLMAAENCPWKKGRKSDGIVPHSITQKSTKKRSKKSLRNNYVSSPRKEMALVPYDRSCELCITMTPSIPPELDHKSSNSDEASSRKKVMWTLRMFQLICRKLTQGEEKSKTTNSKDNGNSRRIDLRAASMLKESNQWVNRGEPIIGSVPGVEVGDEFHYRVELSIIGIHRPFQGGIDYKRKNGVFLATSIVASGGYPDDIDSSDVLIYSGSGGNATGGGDKQIGDQKLERGNLALKNSIDARNPVRVVYGSKELIKGESRDGRPKLVSTFTYDGLYIVEKYWPERGNNGFHVFKFQLRRIPGQPEISLREVRKAMKSKVREGVLLKDISNGKESMPICAINTIDGDRPMPSKYITKVKYPSRYIPKPPRGCDCTDGCSDSKKCACAVKNGGDVPFNYNGAIIQAKPLVYECGPSCKCPPSCYNRVSQHGIKLPLEIFKTSKRGWGVRSLYSIPSGSFVCEYVGEMLDDKDAEERINDEYLFDIGHNYDDHNLWEGLSCSIPGLELDAASETETTTDVGFTIDAAEFGNVGRFINHSCSPNLYAQNLLYDHDDKKMPHVMFFAVDNIPPLQELTYHYNYSIGQVRDSEGNVKKKECFCGSSECTGRLY